MVTLDFSKCKSVEDVEKVFKSKEKELSILKAHALSVQDGVDSAEAKE